MTVVTKASQSAELAVASGSVCQTSASRSNKKQMGGGERVAKIQATGKSRREM